MGATTKMANLQLLNFLKNLEDIFVNQIPTPVKMEQQRKEIKGLRISTNDR